MTSTPLELQVERFDTSQDDVRAVIRLSRQAGWVAEYYPVEAVDEDTIRFSASDPSVAARLLLRLGPNAELVEGDEVARDLAIKFNNQYGETFVVPEPAISETMAIIPGIDGQKMSKSYGNTIPIFLEGKELKKRVMAIETDATPVEEPKNPDNCNLYKILQLFAAPARMQEIHDLYINGGAAYGYLKLELLELLNEKFGKARKKKQEYLSDPAMLRKILAGGAEKARKKAAVTLDLVRSRVGLTY